MSENPAPSASKPKRKRGRKRMSHKRVNPHAGAAQKRRGEAVRALKTEQRREEIAQLRLKGYSVRHIARQLGMKRSTVQDDLTVVYVRTQESADDAITLERQMSLARLDLLLNGIIDRASSADLEAIDRVLKIDHRRAKLLGLDAPAKMEHAASAGVSEMLSKVSEAVARKRRRDGAT
jgi:lambda repressor-like predicted transcriptional regulator